MNGYEIAAGTIQGRDHKDSGKSNQDAYYIHRSDTAIISCVCDGCSEGKRNEVGSSLISRYLVMSVLRHWDYIANSDDRKCKKGWRRVEQDVVAQIRNIAIGLGGSLSEVVSNFFLCTIIGCVITNERIIRFSLGDGVWAVNGEHDSLGPFPQNSPPYIGYNLLDSIPSLYESDDMHLRLMVYENTSEIMNICFGSDGIDYLLNAEDETYPGTDIIIGPFDQFWQDDKYFKNPDMLRRTLFKMNKDVLLSKSDGSIRRERGKLLDDTTVVVIRKQIP